MHSALKGVVLVAALVLAACTGTQDTSRILVFGGTGKLGSEIVKDLVERGQPVTVFARPTSDRSLLDGLEVEYVVGDVLNEDEVAAAFRVAPMRVVIVALAKRPDDPNSPYDIGQQHISRAALETGVEQMILISSVGAGDERPDYFPEESWDMFSTVMVEKGAAERTVLDSPVPYTVIRTYEVKAMSEPPTGAAILSEDESVRLPVTRPDLAALVVGCVDNPECIGAIYHAGDETLPAFEF